MIKLLDKQAASSRLESVWMIKLLDKQAASSRLESVWMIKLLDKQKVERIQADRQPEPAEGATCGA